MSTYLRKSLVLCLLPVLLFTVSSGAAEDIEHKLPLNTDTCGLGTASPWVCHEAASPYLTGNWGGWRDELADKGVTFTSSFVFDVLADPVGGMKTGQTVYDHSWGMDLEVDLEKAFGWKGGIFHTSALWRAGANISQKYIGNVFTASSIFGSEEFKFYALYLDQKFLDDKLSIRVGRFTAGDECAASPLYWIYVNNSIDGNPQSLPINMPFLTYPNATWGARAKVTLPHDLYSYSGIFNGDPNVGRNSMHGFDFSLRLKRGVFLIEEVGWTPNQAPGSEGLPGNYKFGAFYHSGTFRQFYRDSYGGSSVVSGRPLAKHIGNWGMYWQADQMIYRENGTSDQGLTLWSATTYAPADLNQFPLFVDGGIIYKGLIPYRDQDVAAVGTSYGLWSNEIRRLEQDNMDYNGSTQHRQVYEMMFDFTYKAQITPWLYIQPDMQYILHPGGTGYIRDAYVIGFRTGVTF